MTRVHEAIVLAGGQGTRLRSVVNDVPKPMALIQGKPFLEILIETFYQKGIKHFILSVGYLSDVIIKHFANRYSNIRISFFVEDEPLGTGGAIRAAMTKVESNHALILNGDSLFDIDLTAVDRPISNINDPIIFARQVDDVSRYGQIFHEGCKMKGYLEKKGVGPGCVNGGVYVFHKNMLNHFKSQKNFSVEEAFFSRIPQEQDANLIISDGYFIDIGIPESYARAQLELLPYLNQDELGVL
jgi:D-glycero-alpha-D-manno-heptose 1-phosphate guanylyltransferase